MWHEGTSKVSLNNPDLLGNGIFETLEKLNDYEQLWHGDIFTPSFFNVREEAAVSCRDDEQTLMSKLNELARQYPSFPTMGEAFQGVLASPKAGEPDRPLYILSQFALEYPQLQAGGTLLPDLIQLYWWLHNELAYRVTRRYAQSHTISEMIEKADKFTAIELSKLYDRVRDGYNKYLEVIGRNIGAYPGAPEPQKGVVYHVDDNIMLIHFLSEKEETMGHDLLYTVIADIVACHNDFLRRVEPKPREEVYPDEVSPEMCFMGTCYKYRLHGIDECLQLVRSRYLQPRERVNPDSEVEEYPFDFEQLQNFLIARFLSGKPPIASPKDHLRKPFQFLDQRRRSLAMGVNEIDLVVLAEHIGNSPGFKCSLVRGTVERLECEFHSADYNTLLDTAVWLRTATEHLVKYLAQEADSNKLEEVREMKIPEFLVWFKKTEKNGANQTERKGIRKEEVMAIDQVDRSGTEVAEQPEPEDVQLEDKVEKKASDFEVRGADQAETKVIMQEIGVDLPLNQMTCIASIKVDCLYSTLELFAQWLKYGMYDFHALPYAMKRRLDDVQKQELKNIEDLYYAGSPEDMLTDLQSLGEALVLTESDLRKTIPQRIEEPITQLVQGVRFDILQQKLRKLVKLIPPTIQCQHYVALRIEIRRLRSSLQDKVIYRSDHDLHEKERWVEDAPDLWEEDKLQHLRRNALPFDNFQEHSNDLVLDLQTGVYGFANDSPVQEEMFLFVEGKSSKQSTEQSHAPGSRKQSRKEEPTFSSEELEAAAQEISTRDMSDYLRSIDLAQYIDVLKRNGFNGEQLWELSKQKAEAAGSDLRNLGVDVGLHCRKILREFESYLIKRLLNGPSTRDSDAVTYLTNQDMRKVRKAVVGVRSKWKTLGEELELPFADLDDIRGEDDAACLHQVLTLWLKGRSRSGEPTWAKLVIALRDQFVGGVKEADDIVSTYLGGVDPAQL